MSKKIKTMTAFVLVLVLSMGLSTGITERNVRAAEQERAGAEIQARGAYLQSGFSKISKAGAGKVTVGGTTTAQRKVSTVSINVNVERYVNGSWKHYTSWTSTKKNTISVTLAKTISVPKGYSYRVRSVHYANSDVSSSTTNGLYI